MQPVLQAWKMYQCDPDHEYVQVDEGCYQQLMRFAGLIAPYLNNHYQQRLLMLNQVEND